MRPHEWQQPQSSSGVGVHRGAEHTLQTPACGLHGGTPTRSLHTGPMGPPQPMGRGAALERYGVVSGRGHALGPVQSPGVGRALPAPWAFLGTWAPGLASFLSSLSKRAVSMRSTTEMFIERSVRLPGTPLQLTTCLGRGRQPRQRGGQPLPTRRALTLPPWASPVAPQVSLGKMCPRSGAAREVRLATRSLRAQQPEGGGSNPAPVTEQTAVRSGGWLTLARGWVLPGRGGCSASRSTSAFGCCWLLSRLLQPPLESRPAPRRCRNPHQSRRGNRARLHAVLGASACSEHIHSMEK